MLGGEGLGPGLDHCPSIFVVFGVGYSICESWIVVVWERVACGADLSNDMFDHCDSLVAMFRIPGVVSGLVTGIVDIDVGLTLFLG